MCLVTSAPAGFEGGPGHGHGAPDGFEGEGAERRLGEGPAKLQPDLPGEGRLLQEHAPGEGEVNLGRLAGQSAGALGGVGDQFRLGLGQGLAGHRIADGRRGEDLRCERGHLALGGVLEPGDEVVGFVEQQPPQRPLAEGAELPRVVEVPGHEAQRGMGQIVGAAAVAKVMAPAADLGGLARCVTTVTARAGAAEHDHGGGGRSLGWRQFGGGERRFQIVIHPPGHAGPDLFEDAFHAVAIAPVAHPGHANAHGGWHRQLGADRPEVGRQLLVGHQPEIGWSGIHAGELVQLAIRRQRHGARAAAFQPQQDR